MKKAHLNDMVKGWFVGNFAPSLFKTNDVEVAVKRYQKGEREDRHYHKIATEITVIVSGAVKMNQTQYSAGDIIAIEPLQSTDFLALEETVTVVVKLPGENDDKYPGEFVC